MSKKKKNIRRKYYHSSNEKCPLQLHGLHLQFMTSICPKLYPTKYTYNHLSKKTIAIKKNTIAIAIAIATSRLEYNPLLWSKSTYQHQLTLVAISSTMEAKIQLTSLNIVYLLLLADTIIKKTTTCETPQYKLGQ